MPFDRNQKDFVWWIFCVRVVLVGRSALNFDLITGEEIEDNDKRSKRHPKWIEVVICVMLEKGLEQARRSVVLLVRNARLSVSPFLYQSFYGSGS